MSQNDGKDFLHVEDAEDFSLVRHNPRDYQSFEDTLKHLGEAYERANREQTQERRKTAILANLQAWDDTQPFSLQGARLDTLRRRDVADRTLAILQDRRWGSFFIAGDPGTGKTFLAHAIMRRLVGGGFLTRKHVFESSEEELLALPRRGFEGSKILEEVYGSGSPYRLYFLENMGARAAYDEKDLALWEQLLDHIEREGAALIITTHGSLQGLLAKLSPVAAARLDRLVQGRVILIARGEDGLTPAEAVEEAEAMKRSQGRDAYAQRASRRRSR